MDLWTYQDKATGKWVARGCYIYKEYDTKEELDANYDRLREKHFDNVEGRSRILDAWVETRKSVM